MTNAFHLAILVLIFSRDEQKDPRHSSSIIRERLLQLCYLMILHCNSKKLRLGNGDIFIVLHTTRVNLTDQTGDGRKDKYTLTLQFLLLLQETGFGAVERTDDTCSFMY